VKTSPVRIDKPWGYELIWASTDEYVGKILHVEVGETLSLQYHRMKIETMHVLSGRVRLDVGDSADDLESVVLETGDGYHLPAGRIHRLEALETADVLEASTPHLDDLVRLEDRYGRASGGRP
jgi:mannose-6-phosphate isomerase-like protein (cupin superfamily)